MAAILVVDDDAVFRIVVRRYLESAGHRVLEAEDGQTALRMAAAEPVDLWLLDIFMPVKDGIETLGELRAQGHARPVLAISAGGCRGNLDYLGHARLLGADAALAKPFSKNQLLAVVDDLLDDRTSWPARPV